MNEDFIERHGLRSEARQTAVSAVLERIEREGIEMVRMSWPDQYGLLRGKMMSVAALKSAFIEGAEVTVAPFLLDTANTIVFNPFQAGGGFDSPELSGVPSIMMVPDPETFRVLPWAHRTGWILGDLYFRSGKPFMLSPRTLLRSALSQLAEEGYQLNAGLEVEWYLTHLVDPCVAAETIGAPGIPAPPPQVMPVAKGYSLLLENHLDEVEPIMAEVRQHLLAMGVPLRSIEDEWAPGQMETTFDVMPALQAADTMVLFRNAVKQICRRQGYIASFMCKPAIQGFFPSGWHLHQSLAGIENGRNTFVPSEGEPLSAVGRAYVGGILQHAAAASSFTTPTINGYRRVRPFSLAPDRVSWAIDNRAAMVRVVAAPGSAASRIENRVGEPAANPYLYLASQVFAGLDGIRRSLEPGELQETPYAADVPVLPTSLSEALDALAQSEMYRATFGDSFIDYWLQLRRSEWERFVAEEGETAMQSDAVTEWEQREYFELM